ncbi:MAG: Mn-containing catalase [Bryobacterales bacterium]|nr:Mn-containing catalase [Bryobacterales bacterium]
MFHHIKELQFNARISGPHPCFARMLLDSSADPTANSKQPCSSSRKPFSAAVRTHVTMTCSWTQQPKNSAISKSAPLSPCCFDGVNGELKNIAAESRAKIVYEYLMEFTEDSYVLESLDFLMTREIAHFQMFSAALNEIMRNFPPGVLQGNPRYTHTYFNMSNAEHIRG